jgi:hypothetical protein
MTPRVDRKSENGETRFDCAECGETLVRIERGGVLGDDLNDLDAIVISEHFLSKH